MKVKSNRKDSFMEVDIVMQQKRLECAPQTDGALLKDDLPVRLTIYDVPASLLTEFSLKIIRPHYPGGVSDAIKDLMRKAIMEKEAKPT